MGLRKERLADEIRDIIAGMMLGGQMEDPRLNGITITAVELSGDLQIANVFFRVMGETVDLKRAENGLKSAAGFFRKRLADLLDVRRVPELKFRYDESVERGARIEQLLSQID